MIFSCYNNVLCCHSDYDMIQAMIKKTINFVRLMDNYHYVSMHASLVQSTEAHPMQSL